MKISKSIAGFALLISSINVAYAIPTDSLYQISVSKPGSITPYYQAHSKVPFTKPYSDLTDEQKYVVKSKFKNLGVNDTPPYPSNGSGKLYRALLKAGVNKSQTGKLILLATIDANGEVTAIEVSESPSDYLARKASRIVRKTSFDAASCNGVNCEMSFPIEIQFN